MKITNKKKLKIKHNVKIMPIKNENSYSKDKIKLGIIGVGK